MRNAPLRATYIYPKVNRNNTLGYKIRQAPSPCKGNSKGAMWKIPLKKELPQGEQMLSLTASQTGEVTNIGKVSMLGKTMELIGLLKGCLMQDFLNRLYVAKGKALPVRLEATSGEQPLAVLQLFA